MAEWRRKSTRGEKRRCERKEGNDRVGTRKRKSDNVTHQKTRKGKIEIRQEGRSTGKDT